MATKKKAASKNSGPLVSLNSKVTVEGKEVSKEPPPKPAEVMAKVNDLGKQMRELILLTKRVPKVPNLEPHLDQVRSLALAQAHLQTGFLWLRRAIKPEKEF